MPQDKSGQSRHAACCHALTWLAVVLLVALLAIPTLVPPVSAFRVTDHAMCKDVDAKTHECKQRTSQFDLGDEWAFFWFRGTWEASDGGAKEAKFNLYDPDGQQFLGAPFVIPFVSPIPVPKPGDNVVGWLGISVSKAEMSVALWPGISITGIEAIDGRPVRPASEKPGEWRAEFTLDDRVVVSERFMIGKRSPIAIVTQPVAPGLPSAIVLLPIAAIVVVALVVSYMYTRRKKTTPNTQQRVIAK